MLATGDLHLAPWLRVLTRPQHIQGPDLSTRVTELRFPLELDPYPEYEVPAVPFPNCVQHRSPGRSPNHSRTGNWMKANSQPQLIPSGFELTRESRQGVKTSIGGLLNSGNSIIRRRLPHRWLRALNLWKWSKWLRFVKTFPF